MECVGVSVGCFHSVSRGSLMSQWCVSLFEWRIKGVLTLVKRSFMGVEKKIVLEKVNFGNLL